MKPKRIEHLAALCLLTGSIAAAHAMPVSVPTGAFAMGCSPNDPVCDQDEGPSGGVKVQAPAFRIDRFEVTVTEYQGCVARGQCSPPLTQRRNRYCNFGAPDRATHPVNCVDWAQAQAYCQWRGGRLPWEAEWEKAARAGATTRYSWGEAANCKQAILDDGATRGSASDELDGCGEDRTWPVGSRAPNALGLYDMHGNVGEWTGNGYAPDAISRLYAHGNLSGPEHGKQRVARGGSWDEARDNLRASFRNTKPPEQGESIYGSIGFRCVYPAR
jgi:iron(II)-dependent oxidoreductase